MSGIRTVLMGSTALLGAMTPAERQRGRYMRAPDGHGADDGGFAEFAAAGEVEVGENAGDGIETNIPVEEKPEKPAKPGTKKPAAPKPVAKPAEAEKAPSGDEGEEGEEDEDLGDEGEEGEEEQTPKPKPKASERIRELNKRLRVSERLRIADQARLDALEKRLLPGGSSGGNSSDNIGDAPNPSDLKTYPLGHLDDRYIEDKLEWLATKKAAERADAVLQRQQETEQQANVERQHAALLEKVDDLSTRGTEQFEDFQEAVVEAGMRGDWRLDQPTFEAAFEAENGVQILYDLSQDKKEAARVAGLSPYLQLKYVAEKDAEISGKGKPRRIPGAGAPPVTNTRGANSRTRINPSTDNLDDFEKAWAADSKGK